MSDQSWTPDTPDDERFDRDISALFAPVRPGRTLEDRLVGAVRTARRGPVFPAPARRWATATAAVLTLGIFGSLVASVADGGKLPVPGSDLLAALRTSEARFETVGYAIGAASANSASTNWRSAERAAGANRWGEANITLGQVSTFQEDHPSPAVGVPRAGAAPAPPAISGPVPTAGGVNFNNEFANPNYREVENYYADAPTNGPARQLTELEARAKRASSPEEVRSAAEALKADKSLRELNRLDEREKLQEDRDGFLRLGKAVAPRQEEFVQADPKPVPADPAPAAPRKIVIRNGEIEFEVDAFDPAVAAVTKLVVAIPGAFVATVNSDKLPNGKMKGSMVVRVPPEQLDSLVLDLRKELGKAGELKGQRIGSQDITKQYTDLESRLRAARTMEQRLLQIIKDGKGEIKDLLQAEKELGNWRTKIEEFEGELRYFGNLVSLSTLTISLAEKDIKAAAGLTESERVQAGVEVEDVEGAYRQALAAVAEAKGRVTKSEMRQLAAGQFNATLHFEVSPDAAGPIRDRLRQLGRIARLEIDRVQQPEAGTVQKDAKITRGDTLFFVQFYNLANIAPRETAALTVAVADVPSAYQTLRDAVAKADGRVLAANLNEQDRQNVTAQLDFEVRRADEPAVQAALAAAGETVSRQVTRAPEGDSVTDAKVLYRTALTSAGRLKPRETTLLTIEVANVDETAAVFGAQVSEAKGRAADSQIQRERNGRTIARLVYDVPLAAAPTLVDKFKAFGTVRQFQANRDPSAPDGRYATARLDVTLSNLDQIVPEDDGLWPQVRRGLTYSVAVLLTSVTWVVFGLCVVLPWTVVGYVGYRLFRRLSGGSTAAGE